MHLHRPPAGPPAPTAVGCDQDRFGRCCESLSSSSRICVYGRQGLLRCSKEATAVTCATCCLFKTANKCRTCHVGSTVACNNGRLGCTLYNTTCPTTPSACHASGTAVCLPMTAAVVDNVMNRCHRLRTLERAPCVALWSMLFCLCADLWMSIRR